MPETQPEVERILYMRKLRRTLRVQKERLIELHHKYKTFEHEFDRVLEIHPDIRNLYRDMERVYRELEHVRNNGRVVDDDQMKFVRQCPHEECKGFLNEQWFCGLCDVYYCKECNEKRTDGHECDPNVVETMKL